MKKYNFNYVDIEFSNNGCIIYWEDNGGFFGEVRITKYVDGSVNIDDEYMSKEFMKALLDTFIEINYK